MSGGIKIFLFTKECSSNYDQKVSRNLICIGKVYEIELWLQLLLKSKPKVKILTKYINEVKSSCFKKFNIYHMYHIIFIFRNSLVVKQMYN